MRQTVFDWESEIEINIANNMYEFIHEGKIVGTFRDTSNLLTINTKLKSLDLSSPWLNDVLPKYNNVRIYDIYDNDKIRNIKLGIRYHFFYNDEIGAVASAWILFDGKSCFYLSSWTLQAALEKLCEIRKALSNVLKRDIITMTTNI